MSIRDAQTFVGSRCTIVWNDRHGNTHETISKVYSVDHIRMLGTLVITDEEEILLERVVSMSPFAGSDYGYELPLAA